MRMLQAKANVGNVDAQLTNIYWPTVGHAQRKSRLGEILESGLATCKSHLNHQIQKKKSAVFKQTKKEEHNPHSCGPSLLIQGLSSSWLAFLRLPWCLN